MARGGTVQMKRGGRELEGGGGVRQLATKSSLNWKFRLTKQELFGKRGTAATAACGQLTKFIH